IWSSVLWNALIDLLGPGQDTALQIVEVVKGVFFLQFFDGIGTALAASAVHHYFLITAYFISLVNNGFERNEFPANFSNLHFMRLANVDELYIFTGIQPSLVFLNSNFWDVGFFFSLSIA